MLVIVIDKQSYPLLMQPVVAAEGQGFTDQGTTPLPQRVVESLNMIGFATPFIHWTMTLRWKNDSVDVPLVRVEHRTLVVVRWQRVPQLLTGLCGTIAKGDPNNFAGSTIKGEPNPDWLLLVTDKRPEFIHLDDQLRRRRRWRFDRHQDLFLAT